jgi:hypothetical protein
MKRFLLSIFTLILVTGLSLAEVDTQLYFISNEHNNSTGVGTLKLNVEATSTNGTAQINYFEGAFQIDANLNDQFLSISFTDQYFPAPFLGIGGYTHIEEGPSSDGRIRYQYAINGSSRERIHSSGWITIVSITIQYTITNASSTISWYNNLNFTVRNHNDERINGTEMEIPVELTNIALPVELSSFSANLKGENVELKWWTETEVDNFGFEVQRLQNYKITKLQDSEWERIGFVDGNGNSNSPKNYSFTDKNPAGGSKFVYRLKQIDNDGTFTYSNKVEVDIVPGRYELFQNYPNPFNPVTSIKFSLPENSNVKLDVYNIMGEYIATLLNKDMEAGFYSIPFEAINLSSGTYIYRIRAQDFSQTKKMLLLR